MSLVGRIKTINVFNKRMLNVKKCYFQRKHECKRNNKFVSTVEPRLSGLIGTRADPDNP